MRGVPLQNHGGDLLGRGFKIENRMSGGHRFLYYAMVYLIQKT